MASVYKVKYTETIDGDKENRNGTSKTVAATDAEVAIAKIKKAALAEKWDSEDDNGKKKVSRITAVQIDGVECVNEIDIA